MKGKIYIALLISCMTLMLPGCRASQRAETDSVQENEITADGETENSKESDGDNQHTEEVLLSDKENNTAGDKELNDGDDDSGGQEEEVILFRSYPGETDGLLSVAVSTEKNFYVDLSMYPELQELARKDRKEYEQNLRELQSSGTEDISVNEYIKRADTCVYSVLCIGCTEDVTEYTGFNYHVESGRALSLEDVVKDKGALIDALAEQLYGSLSSVNPKDLAVELCKADNHAWNIGYQGLTFYVDTSLPEGGTTQYIPVMIIFAEYPSLFYEEYMQVPEKYAVAEDAFSAFMYDLNEDGTAEEINILGEESNGDLEQLTIRIGDLEKTIKTESELVDEDLMLKYLRCHILHLGDGKNLIYLHTRYALDGLYYGIILERSDSEIKVLNTEAGLSIQGGLLIDPQYIVCTGGDRLLGSIWDFFVGRCWQVDDGGQLQKEEETEYYLPGNFQIETTAELAADEIDQDNESVIASQILLQTGTILTPLRTDNATFVDFNNEYGQVYRVAFEVQYDSDYGRVGMINGGLASDVMKVAVGR